MTADLYVGIFALQKATCARNGSTRSNSCNQDIHFPLCIFPDFWAGGFIVNLQQAYKEQKRIDQGNRKVSFFLRPVTTSFSNRILPWDLQGYQIAGACRHLEYSSRSLQLSELLLSCP